MHLTVGNMVMVVNHRIFLLDIYVCSAPVFISGLQRVLDICGGYAGECELTFNCNKTTGVLFSPKSINNLLCQIFF